MPDERKKLVIGLISSAWLLIVFIGYSSLHKPFTPASLLGLIQEAWMIISSLLLLSLAGGIGNCFKLDRFGTSPIITAATEAVLGMGVIGIVTWILGVLIGVNDYLSLIILISVVFLRNPIFNWLKRWTAFPILVSQAGRVGKTIAIIVGAIVLCVLAVALAPTTQFDALVYHLTIPKEFIQQGRITYIQNNMFWGMTQLIEMHFMLLMLIAGEGAAHVFGLLVGLTALAAFLEFAANSTQSLDASWGGAACLLCGSALTTLLSAAYVEWFSILYGLLVLVWLDYWIKAKTAGAILVIGLICGIAIGTKYSDALIPLSAIIIILIANRKCSIGQQLSALGCFLAGAAIMYVPWALKNLLATSNPFYPIFLATRDMDAIRLGFLQAKPSAQDWSRLILIPWQATIYGGDNKEGYSAAIGPLLLGLSPFAGIFWRNWAKEQSISIRVAALITAVNFFVWAIGSEFRDYLIQTRLFMSFFPAWALVCCFGLRNIYEMKAFNIRFGNVINSFVLMALFFNFYQLAFNTIDSGAIAVAFQSESRDEFTQKNLGAYKIAMDQVNALPPNSRVLMLWEPRSYYCLVKCDPDEAIDRWYHDWTEYHDANSVVQSWKEDGYAYVLLFRLGMDFIRENDHIEPYTPDYWSSLQATLKQLKLISSVSQIYDLYEIQ